MSTDAEIRRHELFERISEIAMQKMADYGVDGEVGEQAACAIIDALTEEWGGQYVTIPKDMTWKIAVRDLKVYNDFDGRNYSFLSKKYKLTVRTIYDIIKRVRRRGDPNQPTLF